MKNLIELKDITRVYQTGETQVRALRGVTYNIVEGDFLAIMGPSGSGKSTLMNILGCLDRPTAGSYFLDAEEVSKLSDNRLADIRNKKIGFIFQSFGLLSRTSAFENVIQPTIYDDYVSRATVKAKAMEALKMVGLAGREHHKTNQLSGGEQQRVAIARSLINDPSIIMADEPTGNLDSKTSVEIMEIFKALNAKGKTVILVTHESDIALFANRTIRIKDGLIAKEEVRIDITKQGELK